MSRREVNLCIVQDYDQDEDAVLQAALQESLRDS